MERELFAWLVGILHTLAHARRRPAKGIYSHQQVLVVWLWAVIHDRPVSWATRHRNWPWHDRIRPLPSNATMSRRLRGEEVIALQRNWLAAANARLTESPAYDPDCPLTLDARPLALSEHTSEHTQDKDAGKGRAAGRFGWGYKLHQIADNCGVVHDLQVMPLNVDEGVTAGEMLRRMTGVYNGRLLLADRFYDLNKVYDAAAERQLQLQLVAPRRFSRNDNDTTFAHMKHSPHRRRGHELRRDDPGLLEDRRDIEGRFGTQGNEVGGLGPLPNHVRGLGRVRRWVVGKLLVDAAHQHDRYGRMFAAIEAA